MDAPVALLGGNFVDTAYFFEPRLVLPGDILLTARQGHGTSAAIRIGTFSKFSHAAIAGETGIFLEAQGEGVRRLAAVRLAIADPKNVRLLRLLPDVKNGLACAGLAAAVAQKYVSRGFWLAGTMASVVPGIRLDNRSRFFCSHLVAQAYREAGVELLPHKEPAKVYPGMLLRSRLLRDVTRECVIGPKNLPSARTFFAFVDGEHVSSPHDVEIGHLQSIHASVLPIFKKWKLPAPSDYYSALEILAELAYKGPDVSLGRVIDGHFSSTIRRSGYLEFTKELLGAMREAAERLPVEAKTAIKVGMTRQEASDELDLLVRSLSVSQPQLETRERERFAFSTMAEQTGYTTFAIVARHAGEYADVKQMLVNAEKAVVALLQDYVSREPGEPFAPRALT